MRKQIVLDLKLLATGVGLGGLICAALVGGTACGTVATVGALTGLALRFVEARA